MRARYEELISRLLSLSEIDEIDAIQQEPGICRITMECIGAIKEIAIEAADAIEGLQKLTDAQLDIIKQHQAYLTKQRWTPVTERLPEEEGNVLVYLDGIVHIVNFSPKNQQFNNFDTLPYNERNVFNGVTH